MEPDSQTCEERIYAICVLGQKGSSLDIVKVCRILRDLRETTPHAEHPHLFLAIRHFARGYIEVESVI